MKPKLNDYEKLGIATTDIYILEKKIRNIEKGYTHGVVTGNALTEYRALADELKHLKKHHNNMLRFCERTMINARQNKKV